MVLVWCVADTNRAVAGKVMGARLGDESIPKRWVEGLVEHHAHEERCERLMAFATATGQ